MVRLDSKLSAVVGDRTAKVLSEELGINLLSDLLRHYPRRYVVRGELSDFESIKDGEEVTVLAKIKSTKVKRIPGRKGGILEVEVSDGRSTLLLTFFNQVLLTTRFTLRLMKSWRSDLLCPYLEL